MRFPSDFTDVERALLLRGSVAQSRLHHAAVLTAAFALCAARGANAEPPLTVKYVGPVGAPSTARPRDDAERSLAAGRLDEALFLYQVAIERDPYDRRALRDGGRVAFALGKTETAEELLAQADVLTITSDPELLYLLGEAQWTLGNPQARDTHERALREIGPAPKERMPELWAARIHSRLGDREAADAIYRSLLATNPADAESALAFAEMHAQAGEWEITESVLQAFLAHVPDHVRAREMLAWAYEARGRIGPELQLRKKLVAGAASAQSVRDYGRALERSGDWAGALAEYRRAAQLPDGEHDRELAHALDRVQHRMSVELATGATGRTDPTSADFVLFGGVAAPFGRASHGSASAMQAYATSNSRNVYSGEVRVAAVLHQDDATTIVGAKVGAVTVEPDPVMAQPRRNLFAPAAFFSTTSGTISKHLKIALDGELGALWQETPRAVFEAGRVDVLTGRFYVSALSGRFIIDTGAQPRHLRLTADATEPEATQLLMWTGADVVLWADYAHEARGQILDNAMLLPAFVADSGTVAYRHYEMFGHTEPMFASRLKLADRAEIDEVSFIYRKVARGGTVSVEAIGGFGRDWARDLYIERGALALWLAPTAASRLSLSFDLARESVRGLAGERRTGMVSYHVDL